MCVANDPNEKLNIVTISSRYFIFQVAFNYSTKLMFFLINSQIYVLKQRIVKIKKKDVKNLLNFVSTFFDNQTLTILYKYYIYETNTTNFCIHHFGFIS